MSALEPEVIASLKAKHGDIRKATADGVVVVYKRPGVEEWDAYMAAQDADTPAAKPKALIQLFRDCCVWPAPAEVDEILRKQKGLGLTFGAKVLEFGGVTNQIETEKL